MHEAVGAVAPKPTPPKSRSAQLKGVWRDYSNQVARKEIEPTLRVGIAASFTANNLAPFFGGHLVEAGLKPAIEIGPYNQLFQVCLDYGSHFRKDTDVLVLLFRIEDIVFDEVMAFLHGDTAAFGRASEKIGFLASSIKSLRDGFAGTIIVNLPPYPDALPVTPLSLENPLGLGNLHRALTTQFLDRISGIPGIRLFDLDAVQREVGLAASFHSQQWYLYHQPYTEPFLVAAGTVLGRMVASLRRAPKKCIVLDCDNTLWGGIIGEDGLAGIKLGDEFPGTGFRDFQRLLLYWREQGVFLAIASKNNEADVWEVFEKHTGMLLKREHISAFQIHWQPKSEGIPAIAKALNIGIDSLVFIDDNPMEIDFMRAAQPDVACVVVPEDPADILGHMRSLPYFDRLEITNEDRQRANMMQAEQQREALGSSMTKEEFRKSLGLKLDFFRIGTEDLDRITQLINKTNQFNLTTVRRSVDEVRALTAQPNFRIYGLRVADKFGEYGLTGVVLAEIASDRPEWIIDTFLLSCRVLGRGVETALLAALADEARAGGAEHLLGAFIPSAKNAPAASFLPDHGFTAINETQYRIGLGEVPEVCSSITLIRPVRD